MRKCLKMARCLYCHNLNKIYTYQSINELTIDQSGEQEIGAVMGWLVIDDPIRALVWQGCFFSQWGRVWPGAVLLQKFLGSIKTGNSALSDSIR